MGPAMTTQAKNWILAIPVLVAILISVFGCSTDPTVKRVAHVSVSHIRSIKVFVPKPVDPAELDCMRMNIFHEARGESERGMEAVALVVLNRTVTKHFPSTVCGVVHQGIVVNGTVVHNMCQFSWYCDGLGDEPDLTQVGDRRAWEMATTIAKNALEGKLPNFIGRATHYHNTSCEPFWSKDGRFSLLTRIGSHLFYRDRMRGLKA
jgi:spore germination cell wall hydrolase CwlJ-like protein